MKRIIATLLMLLMLLSLCACGKSESEIRGQVSDVAETPAEEEPAEEAVEEEAAEAQVGSVTGGRYESSFLGIGCELDENWVYASQEEMAELLGVTADMFEDESYAEAMKNADMFYDMYAIVADGTTSINVLVQNLGLIYGTVLSEEEYVEL